MPCILSGNARREAGLPRGDVMVSWFRAVALGVRRGGWIQGPFRRTGPESYTGWPEVGTGFHSTVSPRPRCQGPNPVTAEPLCASGFWPQEDAAEQGQDGRRWQNRNKTWSQEVMIPALGGSLTSLGLCSFLVKSS